jgi:phosphatidylglycerol:prolipoprotein diacylglycerol transferase
MSLFVLPFPNINPIALEFGPLSVKWYGLAYMVGLLLGWFYIKHLLTLDRLWPAGKRPFEPSKVDDLLIFMTLGVLLGGRLGFVLFYEPAYFLRHPLDVVAVWNGGMAFHGALLGSILAMVVFSHRLGTPVLSVMDLCAAATPMGLFFGRIANFINGELWGRPSTLPWSMVFPDPGAGHVPRHPSQLYEATLEGLVLFGVLAWLTYDKLALRRPGLVAGAFLAGYGLARSFCEFFRAPDPRHLLTVGPFTAGMLYSLPMIVLGVVMLYASRKRARQSALERTAAEVDIAR